ADVASDNKEADGKDVEVFPAPDHALEVYGVGVFVAAGERSDGDHTSLCLAACHSASISSMDACCGVLPWAAKPSSTCAKRRRNFALVLRRACSGSTFKKRAMLTTTNRRSPISSSISEGLPVARAASI